MKRSYQLTSSLPAGPLQANIATFIRFLSAQGYSSDTVDEKRRLVIQFDQWLLRRRVRLEDFNETHIQKFLHHRRKAGHGRGSDLPALRSLVGHLTELKIIPLPIIRSEEGPLDRLQMSFDRYLSDERGLKPATRSWYLYETRGFLNACFGDAPISLTDLSAKDIRRYLLEHARSSGPGRVQHIGTALRSFLRFLFGRGDINTDLAVSVPRVAQWRSTELPKYLSPAEVELLLKSCGNTVEGKRSRAVLLLLARLGLRAGEVVQMTLDDINWDAGEVLVRGKGGRQDRLPIPGDAGKALAVYLRQVRPACLSRQVFVRLRAPYQGLKGSASIGYIVGAALKRARLNPPLKGAHLLRHSLATRMLRRGVSLSDIGKILRHQLPATTAIYAKVDLDALRALAMPWPGGAA